MNSEYARKQRGSEARAAVFFTDGHALQAMRNRVQRMRDGPARGPEEKKKKKKRTKGKREKPQLAPVDKRRATSDQAAKEGMRGGDHGEERRWLRGRDKGKGSAGEGEEGWRERGILVDRGASRGRPPAALRSTSTGRARGRSRHASHPGRPPIRFRPAAPPAPPRRKRQSVRHRTPGRLLAGKHRPGTPRSPSAAIGRRGGQKQAGGLVDEAGHPGSAGITARHANHGLRRAGARSTRYNNSHPK